MSDAQRVDEEDAPDVPTHVLRPWIESHIGNRHFGADRKKKTGTTVYGTNNGNHRVLIERSVRLIYSQEQPVEIPSGSELFIYRRFERSASGDIVAIIFAPTFHLRVYGSGKVTRRDLPR